MTDVIEEAAALADEAKKPGVFNILSVLKDRGLPRDVVQVVLDDALAYDAAKIQERINELMSSDAEDINDEVASLQAKLDVMKDELNANRYAVHITGITEGKRDELVKRSLEKFPMEYDEQKNAFTGETIKRELESSEREEFFTNLLWVASIDKIVAPDGSEQAGIPESDISEFRAMLPIIANSNITQAIEKLRVASAMFVMSADEDFLAKP